MNKYRIGKRGADGATVVFSAATKSKVVTLSPEAASVIPDVRRLAANVEFATQGLSLDAPVKVELDGHRQVAFVVKAQGRTVEVPVEIAKIVPSTAPAITTGALCATQFGGGSLNKRQAERLNALEAAGFTPRLPVFGPRRRFRA